MMRGALLVLTAVTLVAAATDAAPAAPRGVFSGVVILNSSMPAGNATRRRFAGFMSRFSSGARKRHATQAKPRGQIRSQMMFTVGHLN